MTIEEIRFVVGLCEFMEYTFVVEVDTRGTMYLRAWYDEADKLTGTVETQYTRRWLLSPEMSKSEIVQTVFKCALTSMEHRTREWFMYQKRSVFGPHIDIDVLHTICVDANIDRRDVGVGVPS